MRRIHLPRRQRAQDVDVGAGGASGGHAGGCHAMTRARVMAASARSPLGAQAPAAHSPRPAARLPNGRARASPGLFHSLRCSRPYLSPQLSLACSPVCPPTSDCYAPQASSSSGLRPTPTRPRPPLCEAHACNSTGTHRAPRCLVHCFRLSASAPSVLSLPPHVSTSTPTPLRPCPLRTPCVPSPLTAPAPPLTLPALSLQIRRKLVIVGDGASRSPPAPAPCPCPIASAVLTSRSPMLSLPALPHARLPLRAALARAHPHAVNRHSVPCRTAILYPSTRRVRQDVPPLLLCARRVPQGIRASLSSLPLLLLFHIPAAFLPHEAHTPPFPVSLVHFRFHPPPACLLSISASAFPLPLPPLVFPSPARIANLLPLYSQQPSTCPRNLAPLTISAHPF